MLFFKKEKSKPRKTRVNAVSLNEKYQDLLGDYLNDFEVEVSKLLRSTEENKREIETLLEKLKNAGLKNENVHPKEKSLMEGNRLSYIKTVSSFISSLEEPENISDETAKLYLASYAEKSEEFKKNAFRPGQITMHFFGDIIKDVNGHLAGIDKNSKELLALLKSENIRLLSETKYKITLLQKEIGKNDKFMKELEQSEIDYEELKKERAIFEQRINSIKKNGTFLQLNELNSLLRRTEEELKIIDAEFIDSFLQIEKALKRLPKDNDDVLANKYLDDPVSAVLNDPELRVMEILNRTGDALKSGVIEIEEKRKDKLIEKIAALSKEKFTRFVIAHNDLTLKINEIGRRIKQNNSQRDLDDIKYRLEHVQKKQENAGESIKRLNQQIENSKIVELKESIEKAFESLNAPIEVEIYEADEKKGS